MALRAPRRGIASHAATPFLLSLAHRRFSPASVALCGSHSSSVVNHLLACAQSGS
jgi:hypothetical protein